MANRLQTKWNAFNVNIGQRGCSLLKVEQCASLFIREKDVQVINKGVKNATPCNISLKKYFTA